MGAKFGHKRNRRAADVVIAGRPFTVGVLYASRSRCPSSRPKRLLAYEADHPRWPGGRVVYQTATAKRPSHACGLWWAAEAGEPVRAG